MIVKRVTLLIAALLCALSVNAQQSKTDESVEFRPHWDLQLQGGVGYTVGESVSFGDLASPSLYLSTNYRFHPAMGVRFGLGGWQGRGVAVLTDSNYAFKFMQLNADYKLDLCSLFGGYNHRRVAGVYLLAGAGLNYGFNNRQAESLVANLATGEYAELEYLWDSKMFVAGRFGVGIDFRVGERVLLNLEANANVMSDKFNSKRANNADWQFNLLAGVSYSFGKKHRTSQKWVDEQEAIKAAELLRQQQETEAEAKRKAAEEQRLAEENERQRLEAEQKAKEDEARKAAEIRQANIQEYSEDIFFTIGSATIRKAEAEKVKELAQWLCEHTDYEVYVIGYADKETGTAQGNMRLSQRRAEAVKAMLIKQGVEESRIEFGFVGDTEQPFKSAEQNRVVICTLI
ncbi:MAG: OmpA family protein [Rikenellaceae bacterium]|nr:OmpA family protein [Rikenellaceae bacterium]